MPERSSTGRSRYSTRNVADSVHADSAVRTVLFCHAVGFTGLVWRSCASRMRVPVRAVAPDLRGHGDAGPLPPDADWSVFAEDVLAAAGSSSGPLVGVGHSLGGTALLLAEAAAPGTFDLLVCYEPILATRDDPAFAAGAARRRAVFPSREEARARYAGRPPLSSLAPEVLSDYLDSGLAPEPGGGVRLRCAPATEAHLFRTAVTAPWRAALPRVGCPTVLLHGAESTVVSGESLREVSAELRSSRVVNLPEMDHLGPLSRPGAFAAVLDGLLAESGGESRAERAGRFPGMAAGPDPGNPR